MGSVGDAYDNALCESFFATLECELLDRQRFRSQLDARLAITLLSAPTIGVSTKPGQLQLLFRSPRSTPKTGQSSTPENRPVR
jgi:hypothetical protein